MPVNSHYRLESRRDKDASGRYYLYTGLPADFLTLMGRLNSLESAVGVTQSEWADPPGDPASIGYPTMAVDHSSLGTTNLAAAINYARERAGAIPFPFSAFPTSETLGTGHFSNAISMRHPLEAFQAIGRRLSEVKKPASFGGYSTGAVVGPFANDFDIASQDDPLDSYEIQSRFHVLNEEVTDYLIQCRLAGGSQSRTPFSESTSYHVFAISGIDTKRNADEATSSAILDDFEKANSSKIAVRSLGGGSSSGGIQVTIGDPQMVGGLTPASGIPSKWWEDDLQDYTGNTYRWQPVDDRGAGELDRRFGFASGTARMGSKDTIPATVGEALAGIGRTTGRYVYICPPISVGFERGAEQTITYFPTSPPYNELDPSILTEYAYRNEWAAKIRITGGGSASGGNWLFWNEPVLPSQWPNDEFTAPA